MDKSANSNNECSEEVYKPENFRIKNDNTRQRDIKSYFQTSDAGKGK